LLLTITTIPKGIGGSHHSIDLLSVDITVDNKVIDDAGSLVLRDVLLLMGEWLSLHEYCLSGLLELGDLGGDEGWGWGGVRGLHYWLMVNLVGLVVEKNSGVLLLGEKHWGLLGALLREDLVMRNLLMVGLITMHRWLVDRNLKLLMSVDLVAFSRHRIKLERIRLLLVQLVVLIR